MATVIKNLLTLCLALAFLVGATVQLVPSSMALTDMGVRADMAGGRAQPLTPCADKMPNCVDNLGCLTVPALPTAAVSPAIPFRWTSVAYQFATAALSELSIKPELSPPILAA